MRRNLEYTDSSEEGKMVTGNMGPPSAAVRQVGHRHLSKIGGAGVTGAKEYRGKPCGGQQVFLAARKGSR